MESREVFAEIPEFDQSTHYVVQLPPVEIDGVLYHGIEIRELEIDDSEGDWHEQY